MAGDDISKIEARTANSTPGPWKYRRNDDHYWLIYSDSESDVILAENEADAAFVAHARKDIALLIEEVRVLRAYLNKLEAGGGIR